MKKVIFISSTGGHLTELMQLKPLFNEYKSYIITENTKVNKDLKQKFKKIDYLVYGTRKNLIKYFFIFFWNCALSFKYFLRFKPDYIVTTGAHTCVPMCFIAKLFRKKVIYIETFANSKTKSLSGKIIYPIADLFLVQWESMLKLYPKSKYVGGLF
ncbi:MAG: PssD/Cps14F family polysaccharide biosynthesis glycosyltransferase [Bacilli bacterium]